MSSLARVALLCLGAVGCVPPSHDLIGRACDPDHLCPEPLLCVAGACAAQGTDAGVDAGANLLPNGGFEDGITTWYNTGGASDFEAQDAGVRSGQQSARVFYVTAGSFLGVGVRHTTVANTQANQTYCAEGWVRRGTIRTPIWIIVRRYSDAATWEDVVKGLPGSSANPTDDGWHLLKSKLVATPPFTFGMNLRFTADAVAGGEFFVDDVRMWMDPAGACD